MIPRSTTPRSCTRSRATALYRALGSKKTHARRVERLKGQGMSEDAVARIHAPIGLDISAVSPPEIAVAIMGEITARLRAGAKPPREPKP
jgi:xanthine dehydrogenase accessory factor